MKWNKCSEIMPPLGQRVLVYFDGEFIDIQYLQDINESDRNNARTRKDKYPPDIQWSYDYLSPTFDEITHWMELPEAPKD